MRLRHIVNYQHPTRPLVVHLAQGFVALLASGVPQRDFDVLVADLDDLRQELHPYGCLLVLVELVADVASGDVCLASAC